MTLQRIDAGARISNAMLHHQALYYTSVAADAVLDEDITNQTVSTLAAIDAMPACSNTNKRRLLERLFSCLTLWILP